MKAGSYDAGTDAVDALRAVAVDFGKCGELADVAVGVAAFAEALVHFRVGGVRGG